MTDLNKELDDIIKDCYTQQIGNKVAMKCGKMIPDLNQIINLYNQMERLAKIVRKDLGSRRPSLSSFEYPFI